LDTLNSINQPQQTEEEITIDILAILRFLLSHWYWLVIGVLSGLGASSLILRYAVPIYKVESLVLLKPESSGQSGLTAGISPEGGEAVSSMLFGEKYNMDREIEILKSMPLLIKVIDSLGIERVYRSVGNVKSSELYSNAPIRVIPDTLYTGEESVKFEIVREDGNIIKIIHEEDDPLLVALGEVFQVANFKGRIQQVDEWEGDPIEIEIYEKSRLAGKLRNQLSIDAVSKGRRLSESGVIQLSMEGEMPQKLKDIQQVLIDYYNKDYLEQVR